MEVSRISDRSDQEAVGAPSYEGPAGVSVLPSPLNGGLEVRLVRFGPGGRSRPHVCSSGRLVHVVSGEAVAADPTNRIVVGPGDTISVPAGEWHWHGGLPHVAAVLLVVERPGDVSWNVARNDWDEGYDHTPPSGGGRAT
jgi:quercetin dioxygenase-like cupin family protein